LALYIGTSGWAYKEWAPGFYPDGLPQRLWLEHYARTLGACEINATFYRRAPIETFAKWGAAAPESFRFALKAHRALTHSKDISSRGPQRALLGEFIDSARSLGPKLGPILFQIPRHRVRNDDLLEGLLGALPTGTAFAFDFMHESWDCDDIARKVAAGGGTLCLTERAGEVTGALPPGPFAYVRLRFPHYSAEGRAAWAELLQRAAKERDVYVFTKHEGVETSDASGGVGLARWLVEETHASPPSP
jgi:uncharacterized protein YecE (DUF72 family)